jgi:hypothetical protein
MPGFLDRNAPSIEAEYSRYIDGDLLGKLITKNLFNNVLGYPDDRLFIPLGRYGDADVKYKPGLVEHDPGDGYVTTDLGQKTFEIKCARINIANRSLGHKSENWAFTNILNSPVKVRKKYDVVIAIGLSTLGLEDHRYWEHLAELRSQRATVGRKVVVEATPDEPSFLAICSFFILPIERVPTNFFRVNINTVDKSSYGTFRAWGDDAQKCKLLWEQAISLPKEV